MKKTTIFLLHVLLSLSFFACSDDPNGEDSNTKKGDLLIEFRATYNTQPLFMNIGKYTNAFKDTLIVNTFNYYISNLVLESTNGQEYALPKDESYFLIRNDEQESRSLNLKNIPEADYTALRFTIGVDSLKSVADISEREGALDIVDNSDMYWEWNAGYIFFKIEGSSPQAPEKNGQKLFRYHIGGFGGLNTPTANNLREARVPFINLSNTQLTANVRQGGKAPFIILGPNIYKLFSVQHDVSIRDYHTVMTPSKSTEIADNISQMFEFDHLHNY